MRSVVVLHCILHTFAGVDACVVQVVRNVGGKQVGRGGGEFGLLALGEFTIQVLCHLFVIDYGLDDRFGMRPAGFVAASVAEVG